MPVVASSAATIRSNREARGAAASGRTGRQPARTTIRTALALLLLPAGLVAEPAPAHAQVFQPDGMQIPLPLSEDVIGGASCCQVTEANMALQSLFNHRMEANLDWLAHAGTEPAIFSPMCGFKGSLIMRGGGCKLDFGWYNVDLNNPIPPPDEQIYPLVTVENVEAMGYDNAAFHPWVGEEPVVGAAMEDIRAAGSNWAGGFVGFATRRSLDPARRDAETVCTQTHFSEARLNQMSNYGGPWIMALMWRSVATPNAYYIGFEDLPTDPDNFRKLTPENYANDGDFNDFVYLIEGITCEGGGLPCIVGAEGACGFGLTECDENGNIVCKAMGQQTNEVCDNIDNDCDGMVDNGEGLCDPNYVCDRGRCRQTCAGGEFPCSDGLLCEDATGFCVDPDCIGVICEPGKVCMGGECVGGCEGAVCPEGQTCQLGRCFDPCAARAPDGPNPCPAGKVCEGGICVEGCQCRACAAGLQCNLQTGECEDTACTAMAEPCAPPLVCKAGECIDPCETAVCPGGGDCVNGECGAPRGGVNPDVEGIVPLVVGDDPADPNSSDNDNNDDDGGGTTTTSAEEPGCGCRTVSNGHRKGAAPGLLLLVLGLRRMRRTSRRRHEPRLPA